MIYQEYMIVKKQLTADFMASRKVRLFQMVGMNKETGFMIQRLIFLQIVMKVKINHPQVYSVKKHSDE